MVCLQPSLELKSLRSRAAQCALHAAKSTVNAWGAGKSDFRVEEGRQSSLSPLISSSDWQVIVNILKTNNSCTKRLTAQQGQQTMKRESPGTNDIIV